MLIRPAAPADVPGIAEFQTKCWREVYRDIVEQSYLDRVTSADRAVRWGRRLATGSRQIALATEATGAIAGVVSWGIRPDRGLELMSLYVGSAHRGAGLGGRLLRHAIGSAAAFVWVFEPNVRAVAFYTRHGFRLDGGREPDPDTGVSCVRMSRPAGELAGIRGTRVGE
jgi:ribosomal protein S18 acetylase RimI-like enzyme